MLLFIYLFYALMNNRHRRHRGVTSTMCVCLAEHHCTATHQHIFFSVRPLWLYILMATAFKMVAYTYERCCCDSLIYFPTDDGTQK